MTRAGYSDPAPEAAERLIEQIFSLGEIGYVALDWEGDVVMRAAEQMGGETTQETNFYEGYLVNPAVVQLLARRGRIDCGGMRYVAVGYGKFVQVLMPIPQGHVSFGVSTRRDIEALTREATRLMAAGDMAGGARSEAAR